MRAWLKRLKRSSIGHFFFDTYLNDEVREEMNTLLSLSRKDPWKDSLNDAEEQMLGKIRSV